MGIARTLKSNIKVLRKLPWGGVSSAPYLEVEGRMTWSISVIQGFPRVSREASWMVVIGGVLLPELFGL
jgi:hypothetical protein